MRRDRTYVAGVEEDDAGVAFRLGFEGFESRGGGYACEDDVSLGFEGENELKTEGMVRA